MEATLKDKNGVAKEAWVFVLLRDTVMVSIDRQLEKAAGMGILDACIAALTTAISVELLSEAEGRFFPSPSADNEKQRARTRAFRRPTWPTWS